MISADAQTIAKTWCDQAGIQATAARIEEIGAALVAAHRQDIETGVHTFVDEAGHPMIEVKAGEIRDLDVVGFLTKVTKADPRGKAAATPTPATTPTASGWQAVQIGSSTGYRRHDDGFIKVASAITASDDAALAKEIAGWKNPWSKNHMNRTKQAVITNKNPALASKLKAEARA